LICASLGFRTITPAAEDEEYEDKFKKESIMLFFLAT
jgi:hypothetical protein